jgi:transposase
LTISDDSLLRRIRRFALPPQETPKVLGIDDWAKRRGHSYGTILVDLEKRRPIELLADREAATVKAWFQTHPGVEIISRDRGGAYGEAARQGAPTARQVADRWHLLKNLGDAVERSFLSHQEVLSAAAKAVTEAAPQATPIPALAEEKAELGTEATGQRPPTRAERQRQMRREGRQQRYKQVCALAEAGLSKRAIARQTRLSRITVRKYLMTTSFPEIAKRQSWSAVNAFLPYLQQRWETGCRNATQLWREIQEQGYRGTAVMVRLRVRQWREGDGRKDRHRSKGMKPSKKGKPPSPRRAMWLLLGDQSKQTTEEQALRGKLSELSAETREVTRLAVRFQEMVRERKAERLDEWLKEAKASEAVELGGFARGIEQDRAAVEAALSEAWSNGQTEGQINRLKFLKRQMYGRAKFDLLRARVLHKV